jgi:hypothetical protein
VLPCVQRRDALSTLARQEVVWAVRHGGIGDAFFDRDAVRPRIWHWLLLAR